MNESQTALEEARSIVGSFERLGAVCGTTGRAVRKWRDAGRLPRTEYSGETDYAARIEAATGGRVCASRLLSFRADGKSAPTAPT